MSRSLIQDGRVRCGAVAATFVAVLAAASPHAAEPLADPTRPPAAAHLDAAPAAPAADGTLVLRAILHADDRRIAVINDRRVRVSESIGDARVLAIEIDRVRLRRGDELIELELVSPAFKNARLADAPAGPPAAIAAPATATSAHVDAETGAETDAGGGTVAPRSPDPQGESR